MFLVLIDRPVCADVVDGAIIGEASKSRLVFKLMEQEFMAMNKKNSITYKFHKNVTPFTTVTCCYKIVRHFCNGLCSLSVCRLGLGIFVFSPAVNIQHNGIPAHKQTIHCGTHK